MALSDDFGVGSSGHSPCRNTTIGRARTTTDRRHRTVRSRHRPHVWTCRNTHKIVHASIVVTVLEVAPLGPVLGLLRVLLHTYSMQSGRRCPRPLTWELSLTSTIPQTSGSPHRPGPQPRRASARTEPQARHLPPNRCVLPSPPTCLGYRPPLGASGTPTRNLGPHPARRATHQMR